MYECHTNGVILIKLTRAEIQLHILYEYAVHLKSAYACDNIFVYAHMYNENGARGVVRFVMRGQLTSLFPVPSR